MRQCPTFALLLLGACTAAALNVETASAGGRPVALELVLAVDVSASVNAEEYRLQMQGIASALRDPAVGEAIAQYGDAGVALTMVHWSAEPRQAIDWELVTDAEGAARVADKIERLPRLALGVTTAIGSALELSRKLIAANAYTGRRRTIDVSGDGKTNDGLPILPARNRTIGDAITINGLAILTDDDTLDAYYRDQVVGGSNAFVITAADFHDFQRAFREKLLREIGLVVAEDDGASAGSRFAGRVN